MEKVKTPKEKALESAKRNWQCGYIIVKQNGKTLNAFEREKFARTFLFEGDCLFFIDKDYEIVEITN